MSIRVTVDLRSGEVGPAETIGVLDIGNRSSIGQLCDFDYRFGTNTRPGGHLSLTPWYILRGHDRNAGIWVLVGQILARRTAGREERSDYVGD